MTSVNPYSYRVEYLFEVIPPELQYLVEPIIEALRKKLSDYS